MIIMLKMFIKVMILTSRIIADGNEEDYDDNSVMTILMLIMMLIMMILFLNN